MVESSEGVNHANDCDWIMTEPSVWEYGRLHVLSGVLGFMTWL